MVRRCWVNFQCRGVLLTWITVGQGPIVLAVGAGGGCLVFFSLIYHFSFLSPSLWETARYRLKYCLKGPLSPKPTNQPTLHKCDNMTRFDCIFIYVDIKTMDKILQITIEIDYLMLMAYKYFFLTVSQWTKCCLCYNL